MAVLVVGRTFLGIIQDLVSLAQLLELFLGGFVTRILVRVIFHGELAVRFFDFVLAGAPWQAEDLIIIAFRHWG